MPEDSLTLLLLNITSILRRKNCMCRSCLTLWKHKGGQEADSAPGHMLGCHR